MYTFDEVISTYSVHYLDCFVCLFVLEFYGPVNNEVMSSRSVNSGTIPRQLTSSKRLTSTKRGRPRQ